MMKYLFILLFSCFQISAFSQYSVKIGNVSGPWEAIPCTNEYEYSWSETLYRQSEILSHGTITDVFYKSHFDGVAGPGANKYMFNQRIFMKLVTDTELSSTAFPDTNQMTLVYAGTVQFLNYELAQIHLDVPFDYSPGNNLLILYVNKNSYIDNFSEFIHFPCDHSETTNRTVYRYMNGSFQGGAGTFSSSSPVICFKYASGLDAGISSIQQNDTFMLPQQTDLNCNFRNYMADTITTVDIEWMIDGIPQSTYHWTGNAYCGQESSPVILQSVFAFSPGIYNLKANTANPNSGADLLNSNDTLTLNIRVDDKKILAFKNYSDNTIPFLSKNAYGWSVSIYNKDSIDFSGQINAIAYYVTGTNGNKMTEPYQKIFMRTTTDLTNSSTAYPDTSLFIKVFDGEIDYTAPGWVVIHLDTVFDYNGSENLMILYENHAGKATVLPTYFKTGWLKTNAVRNFDMNNFPVSAGSVATGSRVPALCLFFSIPKDAGVVRLVKEGIPRFTGNNDLTVDVKNFGLETLQDLDVKYKIDDGATGSYHWNGTVDPLNEITNLHVGSENLSYGDHLVSFWTENPDYVPDYAHENDTLTTTVRACSPLAGTYTVGNTTADFSTIEAAVDSLNNCGINGPVTFNIKAGTYNGQFKLNKVYGSSATDTIVFQSESGDSTDVVITTDSTDYLFYLNGSGYITFKHITFSSDSAARFIVADSTARNCTFAGNVFYSNRSVSTFLYSTPGFDNASLMILDNRFENGNTGIFLNSDNMNNTTTIISGNTFINQNDKSVNVSSANQVIITENTLNVKYRGVYATNADNVKISRNRINGVPGNRLVFLDKCLSMLVSNNFISGSGTGNTGIYADGDGSKTEEYRIINNSIRLDKGESTVYINNVDHIVLYNNVLINLSNQIVKLFSSALQSDHNCFYTQNPIFASFNGSGNVSDFINWKNISGGDANSVSGLPYFLSNTDLHTFSLLLNNLGIPVGDVTTDIDGEPRDASVPDIGADEFNSSCTGPLGGTYVIGATGDYESFSEALMALYNCGITDTTVFNVRSGTYTEQINLDGSYINYVFTDLDTIYYPVTFQSVTGDSSDVILQYDADTLHDYIMKLSDIKNVTIQNLTFKALDTTFARLIELNNFIDKIEIRHNKFIGTQTLSDDNHAACIYSGNLNETDTMTVNIAHNDFENGSSGIDFDFGSSNVKIALYITGNTMTNQRYAGINLHGNIYKSQINDNVIHTTYNPQYGIVVMYVSDTTKIFANKIYAQTNRTYTAIESNSSPSLVFNNFISIKAVNNPTANIIAYRSYWQTRLYYNSILCCGSNSGSYSACIEAGAPDFIVKNNNLISRSGNPVFSGAQVNNVVSDNNNIHTTNWMTNALHSLQEWQSQSGQDLHSVSFLPDFVSNGDLHTHAALLNGKGIPVPGVSGDIDGEPRDPATPDIGADEFANPVFTAGKDTVFCYFKDKFEHADIHIYDIGYGYDSYLWSTGSDSSSILIDTTNTSAADHEYVVTVTTGGNNYTDTLHILYDLPAAIDQTEFCRWNTPVTISANPGYTYYDWGMGDDTVQSITKDCIGCIFNLVVTDDHGCFSKRETIRIHGANDNFPAAMGLQDTVKLCTNHTLDITGNQYGGTDVYDLYSFAWGTGDTTQSLTLEGSTFTPGIYPYTVSVYLVNDTLCVSHDTVALNVDPCAGIGDIKTEDLTTWPNPSTGRIFISFKDPVHIAQIAVYNILGKMVWQSGQTGSVLSKKEIDLSGIPTGIYLLKVRTENRIYQQKLIVK